MDKITKLIQNLEEEETALHKYWDHVPAEEREQDKHFSKEYLKHLHMIQGALEVLRHLQNGEDHSLHLGEARELMQYHGYLHEDDNE